jgi:two-component system sensor histidine kinase KdpD
LLASLSHDLRTPLTAVTVAANNLDTASLPESDRREQVGIIRTEADRLNRLFENIVAMARIETRAIAAEPQWVQPGEVIDTARRQVGRSLTSHPVTVDVDERTVVRLDPRLTSTAIAHVLENAAHYADALSPIEIRAYCDDEGLRIDVRDHGPGISPSDLNKVFDRFYRSASAQHHFGTGMGLAITRGLLAAQGGRVWAENHPAGGAVFSLAIPAETRALATMPDEEAL